MEPRKSDPRIYIITFLFLSCIVSGGVLLGLYVLLSHESPLFLTAGMALVGFPWLFWFLAYLYRCIIKPCTAEISREEAKNVNIDPESGGNKKKDNAKIPENVTSASPRGDDPQQMQRTPREGERHVRFGNATVIGNDDDDEEESSSNYLIQNQVIGEVEKPEEESVVTGNVDEVDRDEKSSDLSGDSDRTPLRLSVADVSY